MLNCWRDEILNKKHTRYKLASVQPGLCGESAWSRRRWCRWAIRERFQLFHYSTRRCREACNLWNALAIAARNDERSIHIVCSLRHYPFHVTMRFIKPWEICNYNIYLSNTYRSSKLIKYIFIYRVKTHLDQSKNLQFQLAAKWLFLFVNS